jgi:hypothetical protein
MSVYAPEQFWFRFRTLAEKDFPVILQTGIIQSLFHYFTGSCRLPRTIQLLPDKLKLFPGYATRIELFLSAIPSLFA